MTDDYEILVTLTKNGKTKSEMNLTKLTNKVNILEFLQCLKKLCIPCHQQYNGLVGQERRIKLCKKKG